MTETAELLDEIRKSFPFVPKPLGTAISFHEVDCLHCAYLRQDFEKYTGPELPDEAIRYVCNELSCLSAAGWRWVLPSYLHRCLTQGAAYDAMETEFLIYSLGPAPQSEADAKQCLSALDAAQLKPLLHFLEWCAVHPHWFEYCDDNINTAIAFLTRLIHERAAV